MNVLRDRNPRLSESELRTKAANLRAADARITRQDKAIKQQQAVKTTKDAAEIMGLAPGTTINSRSRSMKR